MELKMKNKPILLSITFAFVISLFYLFTLKRENSYIDDMDESISSDLFKSEPIETQVKFSLKQFGP